MRASAAFMCTRTSWCLLVAPALTYLVRCVFQVAAILEAAVNVTKRGIHAHPHIMVPLVGIPAELDHQIAIVHKTAKEVRACPVNIGLPLI
jgi:hypothetical protein